MQQVNLLVFIVNAPILDTERPISQAEPCCKTAVSFGCNPLQSDLFANEDCHYMNNTFSTNAVSSTISSAYPHIQHKIQQMKQAVNSVHFIVFTVVFKFLHHKSSIGAAWFLESVHSPLWSSRPHELVQFPLLIGSSLSPPLLIYTPL